MKGIYVLIIELENNITITIGKLGKIYFKKGCYAYVGSALNGLENRINRHFKSQKKFHWHIDYLLDNSCIKEVIYAETQEKKECMLAKTLNNYEKIKKFGSSDCNCESHLFFSDNFEELKDSVVSGFRKNNLEFLETICELSM